MSDKDPSELKQELRALESQKAARLATPDAKNFTTLNKSNMLTPDERSKHISRRAARHSEHVNQVLQIAEQLRLSAAEAAQQSLQERHQAQAEKEKQALLQGWFQAIALGARTEALAQVMHLARVVRSVTLNELILIVFLQRQWRCRAAKKSLHRRTQARQVIVRAIGHWVKRLRLQWRQKHAQVVLSFLKAPRNSLKTAVLRRHHLICLVQRRVRAGQMTWEARRELAQRQFQRVHDEMLQCDVERHVRFEEDGTANSPSKQVKQALAEAKVRTIHRRVRAVEAKKALDKHMVERKQRYQHEVWEWFCARSVALKQVRVSATVDWARAMMSSPDTYTTSFEEFLRTSLHLAAAKHKQPFYEVALSPREMANVVHTAIGKHTC